MSGPSFKNQGKKLFLSTALMPLTFQQSIFNCEFLLSFFVVEGISLSLYMVLNIMLGDALEQCDIKPVGVVRIWPGSLFFQEVKIIMSPEESLDLCFPF